MPTYSPDQLSSFQWIVSNATLRTEDLLPAFWSAVEQTAQLLGQPSPIAPAELASLEKLAGEDSSESDWQQELAGDLTARLEDLLQDLAPAGFYFGANAGDGACFGFWLSEDWADALQERGLEAEDPETAAQLVQLFEDHGLTPDTLADGLAGEADGYSPEQAGAAWCEEFAVDCGMVPDDLKWPLNCLDWERAWRELEMSDGYSAEPNPGAGADYLIIRPV